MSTKKPSITAVIIAKNEELVLETCLVGLEWCDQILLVDNNSSDTTTQIAEQFGAKVISFSHNSFARIRNEALKHITTDWIFYIDADERVTPTLAKEIRVKIETTHFEVFTLRRENVCYGKKFLHGGWENDQVTRIFKSSALKEWQGEVHESPVFSGVAETLQTELIHFTHRSTTDNLKKTIVWTNIEAKLLAESGIAPVSFILILRKGVMEFLRRAIFFKGYKDGLPGLIEALVQGINKILIYIQVWEFQQKVSLEEKYRRKDIKIIDMWKKESVT